MEGTLHLEGNELEIKGATKVVSSTQNQAVVETKNEQVVILGNEIEVKKLNLEEEVVCLIGKFSAVKFSSAQAPKQRLLKRIFK